MAFFGFLERKQPEKAIKILDEAYNEGLLTDEEYREKRFWVDRKNLNKVS